MRSAHNPVNDCLMCADILQPLLLGLNQKMMWMKRTLPMHIANATSVKRLSRALDQLPSGVGQMYDHTLNRIAAQSSEDIAIAWKIFIWLLHAYEPLTVQQMPTALCISFEQQTFDQGDEMPVSIILSICGGLITPEKDGSKEHFRFIRE